VGKAEKMKHIVGFSGGIDSQEAAARVINLYGADDTILINSDAGGNEDPLTVDFIDHYSTAIHPVVRVNAIVSDIWLTEGFADTKGLDGNAILTFKEMIRIKKRPPSRKVQFCTAILKLAPQRRWMNQEFGVGGRYEGEDYERYTGVRRDESHARKNYPDREFDSYFDCWVNHIIAGLTKEECFANAKQRGEEINPLYMMGFGRVGCAPCVNNGKEDILNWVLRRPLMIDKIRDWENDTGYTYFPPMVPGLPSNNTIDQVVEWARTARGGRQQLFPIFHERESCESKYGLCE
jgi:3'-phosphoadenosine 5'-phosphosulfate sulfotransferase (PAPS reductase)/FAD synthetase